MKNAVYFLSDKTFFMPKSAVIKEKSNLLCTVLN